MLFASPEQRPVQLGELLVDHSHAVALPQRATHGVLPVSIQVTDVQAQQPSPLRSQRVGRVAGPPAERVAGAAPGRRTRSLRAPLCGTSPRTSVTAATPRLGTRAARTSTSGRALPHHRRACAASAAPDRPVPARGSGRRSTRAPRAPHRRWCRGTGTPARPARAATAASRCRPPAQTPTIHPPVMRGGSVSPCSASAAATSGDTRGSLRDSTR